MVFPMTRYRLISLQKRMKRPICWMRGHAFNTPEFKASSLYFCERCGKELLGRTFEDLRPLSDEEIEEMHRFGWED